MASTICFGKIRGLAKKKQHSGCFFAVADVYCEANNIDISPETDSGGGPVDFKFSSGYQGRVLVEIKLSIGTVVHGYTTQLKVYEDAAKSFESVFLIIDVGKLGEKLKRAMRENNKKAAKGHRTPDIVVVDATKKPSASNGDDVEEALLAAVLRCTSLAAAPSRRVMAYISSIFFSF